ncbi:hypothetical protein Q8F55_006275 [Vanrija albida]|uniref:DRBM domain-containing protein n=1 Tax=Vanrija albida TaxID=181172 RepID=A0ABR3PWN9_9TREE
MTSSSMRRHSGLPTQRERDSTKAYRNALTEAATEQPDAAMPPPLLPPAKNLKTHSNADNLTAADRVRDLLSNNEDESSVVWRPSKPRLPPGPLGTSHPWSPSSPYLSISSSSEKDMSHSESSDAEEETPSSPAPTTALFHKTGCDITLPQFAGDTFFPHIPRLALDPTLPNMAAEHPARVWNVLLHSLPPDLQPMVQWEYEEVTLLGHAHRLFKVLPADRYSPEYRKVVRLIDGSKTWSGAPQKLKVDAQNHALAACIADDALTWIYSPNVAPAAEDGYNSDGDSVREVIENPDMIDVEDDSMMELVRGEESGEISKGDSALPGSHSSPAVSRTMLPRHRTNYLQQASLFQQRVVNATTAPVQGPEDDFCHSSGLPPPKYTQLILKNPGQVTSFIGQVTVDDELFTGGVPAASLKDARQQVAWMVFTGHFGQRP